MFRPLGLHSPSRVWHICAIIEGQDRGDQGKNEEQRREESHAAGGTSGAYVHL